MKRRTSFFGVVTLLVSGCLEAADSWFYWPGRPSAESLRRHLQGKPHHFSRSRVAGLSRKQLIELHDSHHFKLGHKAPLVKSEQRKETPKKISAPPKEQTVAPVERKEQKEVEVSSGTMEGRWRSPNGVFEVTGGKFVFWESDRQGARPRASGTIAIQGNRYTTATSKMKKSGTFAIDRDQLVFRQEFPRAVNISIEQNTGSLI